MGTLFGGAPRASAGEPPEIKPPTVMPDPDKQQLDKEEFRKLSEKRRRTSTRANTIIGDGETLG